MSIKDAYKTQHIRINPQFKKKKRDAKADDKKKEDGKLIMRTV